MTPLSNDLAAADEANVALGDLLRLAREGQGLTLEDIALSTRIPKRHLEALEQNNLAALPPGPYRRGEVLAYASAVGVDPDLAIAALTRGCVCRFRRQTCGGRAGWQRPYAIRAGGTSQS